MLLFALLLFGIGLRFLTVQSPLADLLVFLKMFDMTIFSHSLIY